MFCIPLPKMIQNYLCIFSVSFMKHKQTGTVLCGFGGKFRSSPKQEQPSGAGQKLFGVSWAKATSHDTKKMELVSSQMCQKHPASRCKNESNARVADVMRKVEMQKKKGGIK